MPITFLKSSMIADQNRIIAEDISWIISSELPWKHLENKTILVTGGGGFLASYIVKSLLDANKNFDLHLRVVCIARNMQSIQRRLADYLHLEALQIFIHDITLPLPDNFPGADIIIHSASQASPKFYGIDPVGTLLANTAGTMYLLEHARKLGTSKFLFFSSSEVYGSPANADKPLTETDFGYLDPMQVRSCYAEGKRMGENMCISWLKQHKIPSVVVRPFHTYGPGMALDDGRVFADFVASAVNKSTVQIKSDGSAMRAFCYIADATLGFLTVLLQGESGEAYNIGNPEGELSIKALANLIVGLYPERNLNIQFDAPATSHYMKSPTNRSCPCIEKVQQIGWQPSILPEEGFRRTISSFLTM